MFGSKMTGFARLALVGLLCASLVASNACPIDQESCYASQACQWDDAQAKCVSSLPCALEQTQERCESNTWDCRWKEKSALCTKRLKQAPTASNPCAVFKFDEAACGQEKRCFWSNFRCKLKPTIVLSLADDLGWNDVGWANSRARTPVLDSLRQSGINLDRHYGSRFCAPTRAMLLTGRYAWRMGLQTDLNMNPVWTLRCASGRERQLLPAALKESGNYTTMGFGKWHMGHYRDDVIPSSRGFDKWTGYYGGGIGPSSRPNQFYSTHCACQPKTVRSCSLYNPRTPRICATVTGMVNTTNGTPQRLVDSKSIVLEDSSDLFLAARAREAILATPSDVPLFMYLSWGTPHDPVYAAESFKQSILKSRPTFGRDASYNKVCPISKRLVHLAMVMTLDTAHAIVIDALEEARRFGGTIFVFLSDNGANSIWRSSPTKVTFCESGNNYPLRGAKFTWWEGGVRTVGLVYSRNYMVDSKRGTSFQGLVSATDWRRTLVKASGSSLPFGDDDGVDLWSPLSGFGVPSRETRTELPLQVWREESRYAVLFYFRDEFGTPELYKLILGYPFSGYGAGNVGSPVKLHSHSSIEQPPETPRRELPLPINSGFAKKWECSKTCLFNVQKDPQELSERSKVDRDALQHGLQLVEKYKQQYVYLRDSGLCEDGYYALKTTDTMDYFSVVQANRCGGWVPWLDSEGRKKTDCE